MKTLLVTIVGLFLLGGLARAAEPQQWIGTGDRGFDATLKQIDTQAKADPDGFFKQLSSRYGLPEQEIRQVKEKNDLGAADIFMAVALAKATNRPVLGIAEEYGRNRGKGWGVMAREMGIKPGSKEFHALKSGALGSLDHMKATHRERQKHEAQVRKEHERKTRQEAKSRGPAKPR